MTKYIYQTRFKDKFIDNQQREKFLRNEMLQEQLFSMKQNRKLRLWFSFIVLVGVGIYVGL